MLYQEGAETEWNKRRHHLREKCLKHRNSLCWMSVAEVFSWALSLYLYFPFSSFSSTFPLQYPLILHILKNNMLMPFQGKYCKYRQISLCKWERNGRRWKRWEKTENNKQWNEGKKLFFSWGRSRWMIMDWFLMI